MTESNKEILVVSHDEELYKSLKRALETIGGMAVLKFEKDLLKKKHTVVLFATPEEDFEELFYSAIRSKYLNPVAVIGYKDKESFIRKHLLFKNHSDHHGYINIPFDLNEFITLLTSLVPISSQSMRDAMCGVDSGYKGYLLMLLSHDLLKGKERCMDILHIVDDYLKDGKLSEEIEDAINDIKAKNESWSEVASLIGKKLEDRIKESQT